LKIYLNYDHVSDNLSPNQNQDLSTKSNNSGDTGYTGDKLGYIMDDKKYVSGNRSNNNSNNVCIKYLKPSDLMIIHKHPFYYCIEHPDFKNINLDTIEHHLLYHTDHKKENMMEDGK
jgi:hypothetical protein